MNKLSAICFSLIVLAVSCSRGTCPLADGPTASEVRQLDSFTTIVMNGKVNLVLTQDSVEQVMLSGKKNFMKEIQTLVSGQTLTIQDNISCLMADPSQWTTVYVSIPRLQQLMYYGAGNVSSTNTLQAGTLTVNCATGAANIDLSVAAQNIYVIVQNESMTVRMTGNADSAYVYCGEAGSVDMNGCVTRAARADSKSVRDIYVNTQSYLQANIVYMGNIYYTGNPSRIDTLITSGGRLIHID